MKRLLALFIICAFCLSSYSQLYATTAGDFMRVVRSGQAIHSGNSCIGLQIDKTLSNNTTGSITLDTTPTGREAAEVNIILDTYADAAIGTMNALSGTVEGDIIYISTQLASQDIVVSESATIYMSSTTRTLSDPKDVLVLKNQDGTNLVEVGFYDNN